MLLFAGVGISGLLLKKLANVAVNALVPPIVIPMVQPERVNPGVMAFISGTSLQFAM